VSKLMKRKRLKFGLRERSHRSIYRYTKFIRYRIITLGPEMCRFLNFNNR